MPLIKIDWKDLDKRIDWLLSKLKLFKKFSSPTFKVVIIIGGFIVYCLIYLLKGKENPISPCELGNYLRFIIPGCGLLIVAQIFPSLTKK